MDNIIVARCTTKNKFLYWCERKTVFNISNVMRLLFFLVRFLQIKISRQKKICKGKKTRAKNHTSNVFGAIFMGCFFYVSAFRRSSDSSDWGFTYQMCSHDDHQIQAHSKFIWKHSGIKFVFSFFFFLVAIYSIFLFCVFFL